MTENLVTHLTSGDVAGSILAKSGLPGEIFVWHDILYDGPRRPGWPDDEILAARAKFLSTETGGGLDESKVLTTLREQYDRLAAIASQPLVLWFDACLFDQSMLAHVLNCLKIIKATKVELLCVDSFPGFAPFNGLGQLNPSQMASLYERRRPLSDEQYVFAAIVDEAFAVQDCPKLNELARLIDPPLSWIPAAAARWLEERPDPETGLGRLERLALEAIGEGEDAPMTIFTSVASKDIVPQYWGDTTLWAKINSLAVKNLVEIQGPAPKLPQWPGFFDINDFKIRLKK